jgi:hypothetical protein
VTELLLPRCVGGTTAAGGSRLGSPVDARNQGSVRGTSPLTSFEETHAVTAVPRGSSSPRSAGSKRWN